MSEENQDEIKKAQKFEVFSKMFGTPSSKYDLLANLFQQPRRKKVRHQQTIGKKRINTRPSKASSKIVGKTVQQIKSIFVGKVRSHWGIYHTNPIKGYNWTLILWLFCAILS